MLGKRNGLDDHLLWTLLPGGMSIIVIILFALTQWLILNLILYSLILHPFGFSLQSSHIPLFLLFIDLFGGTTILISKETFDLEGLFLDFQF